MKRLLTILVLLIAASANAANNFTLINGKKPLHIYCASNTPQVVKTALEMFKEDMTTVSGTTTIIENDFNASVLIGIVGQDNSFDRKASDCNIDVDKIKGKWEAFRLQIATINNRPLLFVLGSDARGAAYGVLELSRIIGVSPWVWWADSTPSKKELLQLPMNYINQQQPSVKYRGIFINDEDFGFNPWSYKTLDPSHTKGHIGPKTYQKVFELLLRLRANTLWPAMHKCSSPFFAINGNREMAIKYGITMGTSHCEPMMCNINGEWDENSRGKYNYFTNKDSILKFWEERVKETANDGDFYTIGMRGVHDGPMEGAKTLNEQSETLAKIIPEQRDILNKYIPGHAPQLFVPYKEVLQVYDNGLKVPDDVTLMWCDDNYGYLTRLSNKTEEKRSGGSGIYYHVSYWGRPHDYLWLCSTQPALIYNQMKRAYDHNARKIWILNVGDIKPAEYDIELFLDLAWNINCITPSTVSSHLTNWLNREFNGGVSPILTNVMDKYYQLAQQCRPEFIGGERTEERGYPHSITPMKDTEFTKNEIAQRLDCYTNIEKQVTAEESLIEPAKRDEYFELIKYPVYCASLMNKKILYAQLARDYLRTNHTHNDSLETKSKISYNRIDTLTHYYNKEICNGKWNYIMDSSPRNLPVFEAPVFDENSVLPQHVKDTILQINGDQYSVASNGCYTTKELGVSMDALSIPVDGQAQYDLNIKNDGQYVLRTAMLPLQPIDGKDLRYTIEIDNNKPVTISLKTKSRDDKWKDNVETNQARNDEQIKLKKGKHTLIIKALDDGIIVDGIKIF